MMTNSVSSNRHNACSFFGSVYAAIKTWLEDIHEYFTHHKETLKKIDGLRQRFFQTKNNFAADNSESLNAAMFGLRRLLEDNAHLQNQKVLKHSKIKSVYDPFNQDLENLRQYALAHKVEAWKVSYSPFESNAIREKESLLRWMDSTESQRRFAAFYNVEIPYKFNEIPAGSVLLTDPYAYLKHMQLEGKLPFWKAIVLNIKSLICRLATGKQFTHVEYAMGNGRVFALDKRKTGWCKGEGNVVDKGSRVFYGMVLAPKEHAFLQDHNERFGKAGCKDFAELSQKINKEIERATSAKQVTLNGWGILKTLFTKKRPANYDSIHAWKDGACHSSCSGTTSAALARFGIRISDQFGKIEENVTPTNFYHSKYFTPLYVMDSLDIKGRN